MVKKDLTQFNYLQVARLDAAMWRSYYNHRFLKLFWQLTRLVKTQLGLSWPVTLRLAFYSAWAAADYRLRKGQVNTKRVDKNLINFYHLISVHSTSAFDYKKTAELELEWWEVHRSSKRNNTKLEKSIAASAAAMYRVKPAALEEYAHYRAEAMILPRHEGDKKHQTNWLEVEKLLVKAWRSLHETVQTN